MKQRLKEIKWSLILASLLFLVLGVALLFWPNTSNLVLCTFIAAILAAYGLFNVLAFFTRGEHAWLTLIVGIICAGFGIYSLLQPATISDIVSTVLGLVIIVDGIISLRRDFELHRLGFPQWWIPLILDIAVILLGVIVIFNPVLFAIALLQIIGVILIYESISDLWAIHRVAKLTRALSETIENAAQEASAIETDVIDIEDLDK